jgi:uncharacterized FlaG/YvyC family protein
MDVNAVNPGAHALSAPVQPIPAEQAAANRDVVQAVKALNATEMFGQGNELTFQMDAQTKRMVIRVINRLTNEVVSQVPPEYVLRLSEDLKTQSAA